MGKLKTALDLIPEKIGGLISDHREDLENAWLKREDDEALDVGFKVKFGLDKGNQVCTVTMSFTPEKVSASCRFAWDEKQTVFPFKKKPGDAETSEAPKPDKKKTK